MNNLQKFLASGFSFLPLHYAAIGILLAITAVSCKKSPMVCCMEPDYGLEIFVQNSQSLDLLNPHTPGAYGPDSINVLYLESGQWKQAVSQNTGQQWLVTMDSTSGKYFLSLEASNYLSKNDLSTTLIRWNSLETDTLQCQYRRSSMTILSIWDNSQLVWGGGLPDTVTGIFWRSFMLTK